MPARDRRRQILELVASGQVTPEEAAQLLAEVEAETARIGDATAAHADAHTTAGAGTHDHRSGGQGPGEPRPAASRPASARTGDPEISQVRVRGNCRAVSIIGDDDVSTAVAEGDHTARVEAGVLIIESLIERSHGFAFIRSPVSRARGRVRIGADTVRPLAIRMNPALALESHVDAGSMTVRGVRGPIRASTSAGAVRIDDFEGPIELRVAAGSASVRGRLAGGTGTSRIECDAGKITVRLTPDSDVTIRGRVNLGQLMAPDVVGTGEALLEVVANLGAVEVTVDDGDDGDDHGDGDSDTGGSEGTGEGERDDLRHPPTGDFDPFGDGGRS